MEKQQLLRIMPPTVTVTQALRRGQWMVNVPVALTMGSVMLLWYILNQRELVPGWSAMLFLVAAITLAWVVWSFAITQWRLWAYRRVGHLDRMLERAIAAKLVWPEGHYLERTEIRTKQ